MLEGNVGDVLLRPALDLPHCTRILQRIRHRLGQSPAERSIQALDLVREMQVLLRDYEDSQSWEAGPQEEIVVQQVAVVARRLVAEIERQNIGEDRLGQCLRNLFECLTLGKEGAELSLLAGENPNSLQRP